MLCDNNKRKESRRYIECNYDNRRKPVQYAKIVLTVQLKSCYWQRCGNSPVATGKLAQLTLMQPQCCSGITAFDYYIALACLLRWDASCLPARMCSRNCQCIVASPVVPSKGALHLEGYLGTSCVALPSW